MILPIIAYGDAVLKKTALPIDASYNELSQLISNMYDTMYNAHGVGLAAPQVGISIRLFIVDSDQILNKKKKDDNDDDDDILLLKDEIGIKKIFINPTITKRYGREFEYNEACLSIPGIREDITRHEAIDMSYYDEYFTLHQESYNGLNSRIIQHEYDHLEGRLFTDLLKPLRKSMIRGKLENISKGKVEVDYRMKFPFSKRK